ncbi:MAG: hypothetical protein HOV77_19620 [Hamadaea sp.]|uniref:hypothetical protein n=1 Tax=Hamadaea sp. TaxID=2024425 RepID=UPI00185C6358|nr:hypothetical protein [Hamadaea sp.]NUT21389.1 hypothetical protein [Hamadaea sp.]
MTFGERLAAMRVRVTLPSGLLHAELRGRSEITIVFEPPTYQRFNEEALEDSLANLARMLWAARTREYYALLSAAAERDINSEVESDDQADTDYREARARLVVTGKSPDGRITITARGMHDWKVTIAPGTLAALSEEEFCDQTAAAAAELISDQYAQVAALKADIYQ